MYERHFGLNKRPFPARAGGNDVFVGPQTAKTMASLKQALASQDAVVAVAGPAGSGKTTLIDKALDALAGTHKTVRIGRMKLAGEDALEYLLEEFGVADLPRGPIRQFGALRNRLAELEAQNTRTVVVVEDASRLGEQTLAELEAMTAADAGDSGGSALVLMGDEKLEQVFTAPEVKRLSQRIRRRISIEPLSAAELRGYLLHCFRLAGADFELIFDARSAALVHHLSDGIPRIANNIVESALAAAAAAGHEKIDASFVAGVAQDEFGLESGNFDLSVSEPQQIDDIPELIQDTLPELEALPPVAEKEPELDNIPELEPVQAPEAAALPEAEPVPAAEPIDDPVSEALEALSIVENNEPLLVAAPEPETQPEPQPVDAQEPVSETVPEWERDPTVAELKPDLDALEKAIALAHGDATDAPPPPAADIPAATAPATPADDAKPVSDEIPEITLDNAIQARVDNNLIDEPGQISASEGSNGAASSGNGDLPEVKIAPRKAKKADAEIEKIAAELARAKSIEDVDDKLAETLFGEEISLIAAQVVAAHAAQAPANDEELKLFDTAAASIAQAAGTPQAQTVALEEPEPEPEPQVEVSLETPQQGGESGLDLSASQRLKTVRALNADLHPSLREPANEVPDPAQDTSAASKPAPEPIENQINTSITQTLKALDPNSLPAGAAPDYDDEPEQDKGGFFSRFRRS